MRSLKFLFFVFILLPLQAQAGLNVLKWNETTQLTDEGKKSVIALEAQVKDLKKDQAMTAFSIGFDPRQKISIVSASFAGQPAKYEFVDNVLKVIFPSPKINNEMVVFKFVYEEKYEKVNQYLRQEVVYVPSFAAGAFATVVINFNGYDLTTYSQHATCNGSNFTYTSIVPKEGIKEVVKFTELQSAWNVTIKTTILAEKNLGEFSVKVPSYFQSTRQKVENYANVFSSNPVLTDRKGDDISYGFRVAGNSFEIKSKAKVSTGTKYRRQVFRNMISYTMATNEERQLMTQLLQEMRNNKKYEGMATYAAIGSFVHNFLEYDKSYVGKLPKLSEIVKDKKGVCTEYAKLYDSMARVAGIPSLVIDGAACGEYEECQGHSWNMIFVNGGWIEVDPTWNLMSGVVSSSHVYINDDGKGDVKLQYYGNAGKVEIEMDLEMKKDVTTQSTALTPMQRYYEAIQPKPIS